MGEPLTKTTVWKGYRLISDEPFLMGPAPKDMVLNGELAPDELWQSNRKGTWTITVTFEPEE